ncbi:20479_t:CDS:2 [Cetraspora pellucida]|uniref:20479_t:CDS:1 n=1 Tax=Cetraspora pellucida TaxID=1433469 RepID=A0A9N9ATR5_9GLOM|nr:20479_t:CDS:2 [Cetraspora pellucida]
MKNGCMKIIFYSSQSRCQNFLDDLNNEDFNCVLEFIYDVKKQNALEIPTHSEKTLIELIQSLSVEEKKNAIKLLENMRYPKGKNRGKIISPYLQQQLVDVISNSLYRPQSSYAALQKELVDFGVQNALIKFDQIFSTS